MSVDRLAVSVCLYKRDKNWQAILDALVKAASGVEDKVAVCFWNNDASIEFKLNEYPLEYHIFNSGKNYVCLPRYFMPLLLAGERGNEKPATHFMFLDDDCAPGSGLFKGMIEQYEMLESKIDEQFMIGCRGAIFADGSFSDGIRLEKDISGPIEVDYLAGQSLFGPTNLLLTMISNPPPGWAYHAEDLWFAYITQIYNQTRKFVVPHAKIHRLDKHGDSLTKVDRNETYDKIRHMGFQTLQKQ